MQSTVDNISAPIKEFLDETLATSCMTLATTFDQLLPPSELTFQVALYILWPRMKLKSARLEERIQAAYLLYHLYAPYDIALNPFKTAFQEILEEESVQTNGRSTPLKVEAPNLKYTLVSVVDCILRGRGAELAPYSPVSFASGHVKLDGENISPRSITSTTSGSSGPPTANFSKLSDVSTPQAKQALDETFQLDFLLQDARHRVLTIPEQRLLVKALPTYEFNDSIYKDLPYILDRNSRISPPLISRLLVLSSPLDRETCYEILGMMRPLPVSFDIMARLLQDHSRLRVMDPNGANVVSELVKHNVLGMFMETCEAEIQQMEEAEGGGMAVAIDSPCALAIQQFCRFCASLLRAGILIPSIDAEITQILRFSLQFSRYREANVLYRQMVAQQNGSNY